MLRIRVNPVLLDLFRERRIFLRHPNDPARPPEWLSCLPECRLEPYSHVFHGPWLPLRLGAFSYAHSPISPNVVVGRFCSISQDVSWIADGHPLDRISTHPMTIDEPPLPAIAAFCLDQGVTPMVKRFEQSRRSIIVGHDVWIGQRASIMPGVRIGVGAVVAAGAVVTADVEPYTIVGGTPAKPIRKRFPDELIVRLLASEWWDYNPKDFLGLDLSDPRAFLDRFEDARPSLSRVVVRALTTEEMIHAASSQG